MASALLPLGALFLSSALAQVEAPPSRALLAELASRPRLAGTAGSHWGAELVAKHLSEAGFEVEIDSREVLLSLPRKLGVEFFESGSAEAPFHARTETFDPDAEDPGAIPPFNAWSANGVFRGPVVDAGRGLREDFERLRALGIDLHGTIALCAYGGAYRGVKPQLAAEFGCAGVLLYNRAEDSGAGRGPVWPEGPWKPGNEAERGSILPIATGPGDPSTPGFASPAPGKAPPDGKKRLEGRALAAVLPQIACLPIGSSEAALLREKLAEREITNAASEPEKVRLGPGPVEARLAVDAPPELRTIRNVIGRLRGEQESCVIAGNHRDAWVCGAHDAGGGTVSLLRAAQHLGERARSGWKPARTILLAFWDAEEQGLIGSTEWAEAHEDWLLKDACLYVNADTAVSGTSFGCSGTPGLEGLVLRALAEVADPLANPDAPQSLREQWLAGAEVPPDLGLPGSGSDFAVFLHHLALPVLDVGFDGAPPSGQYHTSFDLFECVERFIDPGFFGHETAGLFFAALLARATDEGPACFDASAAARAMARHATTDADWLGEERAKRLAKEFEKLAERARPGDRSRLFLRLFYRQLPGRPWFVNTLWAPGLEKGYGSETFPLLRDATRLGEAALDEALGDLCQRIDLANSVLGPPVPYEIGDPTDDGGGR